MDFRELNAAAAPYFITRGSCGPIYDYGVCGAIEQYMDSTEIPYALSYCETYRDEKTARGIATLTIITSEEYPDICLYHCEMELNTYAEENLLY